MSKKTVDTIMELLEETRHVQWTCVDIETRGEGSNVITSMAFTIGEPTRAFAVPLAGRYFKDQHDQNLVWSHIRKVLRETPSIWQNGIFDWGILWDNGVRHIEFGWDTMVAQHLLFTEFPRGLDAMSSLYLERRYHKNMMGQDLEMYNIFDVVTTHEIAREQYKRMDQQDLSTMEHLMKLHEPLIVMEKRGLNVDLSYKEEALADLRRRQRELEQELNEVADRPIKPRSSQDLQKYFYEEKGIKPYLSRDTGRPTVDANALRKMARKGHKECDLILRIREIGKLASTYFNMNLDDDGRLRCQIKPTGTVTGRLATSKTPRGTGANLQNIPAEYGYCILPDPGKIFLNVDLEQAEKRIVALLTHDPDDISDFKQGEDIHSRRAAEVLGKNVEDVTKEERNKIGKPLNHATSYDVGPYTFAEMAGLSNSDGAKILEEYHRQHPGLRKHFANIRQHLQHNNTLRNMFGRPRRFYGMRDRTLYRSAYDYCPQSTVGEICNRAIINLYYDGPEWLELLMQVHDSLLVQVPDNTSAIWSACQEFEKAMHFTFEWEGDTLDIPLSYQIGYRWSKKHLVEFTDISIDSIEAAYKELDNIK